MKNTKIPTHFIFIGIYLVLALVTLIPTASASKECLLGYEALCSFTPLSTIGLIGLACLHIYLHRRSETQKTAN